MIFLSATLIEKIYATNFCKFVIDNVDDLQLLPTTTSKGQGVLSVVPPCSMGSIAITTSGESYILSGSTNSWIKYSGDLSGSIGGGSIGGGGSSGGVGNSGGNTSGSDDFIEL